MTFGALLRREGMIIPVLLIALVSSGCMRSPEQKSARFMEAGKKLLEQKDATRAILQFRNAAQATPNNAEVYYQLGQALLAAGDLRQGVSALQRAIQLNPKHEQARFRLAELIAQASDPELVKDAEQRLQALLQDAPGNADALHALALTELKLGDTTSATQHLEQAIASAPKELVFAISLADAKLQQKDLKGAEAVLTKATRDFPTSAAPLVILGRFYAGQNRAADAEKLFRQALSRDPNHGAAMLNLATLLYQTGRTQEAESYFKRLSGLSDKSLQPTYGNYLFQVGRRDEAVKEFERLAKLDPDDRVARTRLVAIYRAVNRTPEAQKILAEALKKNANDLDALLQLGELSLDAAKYAEAEADLNKVLRMKPDSPEVHYALARLYRARGSSLRQRQELAESLRLSPLSLQTRIELANALIESNSPQAALDILDTAPANQKNLVGVAEQRNWALLVEGKEAEARKGVEQGLAAARTPTFLIQDAILKIRAKRYTDARESLHEVLAKNPEAMAAYQVLITSYRAQNQLRGAVDELKAYVAQHRTSADLQYLLGNLLAETGDKDQARQVLAAARVLKPEATGADLSLARINLLEANWSDARSQLASVLSSRGENPMARLWLGMLEESLGNHAAAIAAFRKVVEDQPNNAMALNNLAAVMGEDPGRVDEALKYAQKAKELEPESAPVDDTLGWVLYRKGMYSVAIQYLESANKRGATAQSKYHLAMTYLKEGQKDRGRSVYEEALRLNPNLPEAKTAAGLFQ